MRNLSLVIVFLLVGCANQLPPKVAPSKTADLLISHWQTLGPFSTAPLEAGIDQLISYGGEENIQPNSKQIFLSELVDDAELRWMDVPVESTHILLKQPRVNWPNLQEAHGFMGLAAASYAYAEINLPTPKVFLIHVNNVRNFWVNDKMYWGQPYSYSYYQVPVLFHAGNNRILLKVFSFGDLDFDFVPKPITATAMFGDDWTTPDLLKSSKTKSWMGIPVFNTSNQWLSHCKLEVFQNGNPIASKQLPFSLAPLTTVKIPVEIPIRTTEKEESLEFEIQLSSEEGVVLVRQPLTLAVKTETDARKRTFLSKIDDSVQYYSVLPPNHFDPHKKYSAILALHGANVEASYVPETYASKDWAFVIAPTNRRPHGFAWQDLGRLDALEVLKEALKNFPIDPAQIFLAGHSMGGQGVWHIGAFAPDLFAGLAPAAGWSSFDAYTPRTLQKSSAVGDPELNAIRDRSSLDANNPYFISNLQELPVFITQASKDMNVPPFHSRRFFKLTQERKMQSELREIDTEEHWCREPLVEGKGYQCVDNPLQYEFLKQHPKVSRPKSLEIHLNDLSLQTKFSWLEVLDQIKIVSPTWIHAQWTGSSLSIESTNIDHIRVNPKLAPAPMGLQKISVVWNGKKILENLNPDQTTVLSLSKSNRLADRFQNELKQYGTMKSVFHSPALLVIGESGSEEDSVKLLHLARLISNRAWATANSYLPIVHEHDLNSEMQKKYNLVLLGNGSRNHWSSKVEAQLPFGNRELARAFRSKSQALMTIWPSLWNPNKVLLLISGGSAEAELQCAALLPLVDRQSSANLDFIITSPQLKSSGFGGLAAAGFYSNHWDLENHDYVYAPENDLAVRID